MKSSEHSIYTNHVGIVFYGNQSTRNTNHVKYRIMKKIVAVGVVTGVVMYTFFRSLSKRVSEKLETGSPEVQPLIH
ncbi:hypothetical protein DSL64_07560 [Dyadobacter luteus]|uniref:Uncharacterized protein n=1 Tax=Dyadobacter luteus TaxID=2259619 RepID=A0A3D8YHG6_9BACT|nr:hypothetical protein DSL64_07560 [Dyadobacter luteus]